MHIRSGTKDDAEQIAELHTRSWLTAYAEIMPPSYLNESLLKERNVMWSTRLATVASEPDHTRCLLVAVDGDALLGFAYLAVGADERILLDNLHVQPERKQSGIGRQLVYHSFGWAAERHPGKTVYLEVLRDNTAAITFYRRLDGRSTKEFMERFPTGFELPVVEYAWDPDAVRILAGNLSTTDRNWDTVVARIGSAAEKAVRPGP
ncbi:GNAT family N-acetyltransferase [Nonomuraea guangzhouensis]|uniref:GNAT family N-acetyltransferase n=1 Tax=Nonomuraea guangzhouensis TaxID=1291555 RepID=A0ABW4GPG3_9ACTN|nr:GNAT family N-acetyltransferase [Nonomuraea guangzhouensis]